MKENFYKTSIAYLSSIYGKINDDLYKLIWDVLKDRSDDEFKQMVEGIITSFIPTSQVPFPLPPHFIKHIGADQDSKALQAVKIVKKAAGPIGPYKSVSFGDRALHETINHFGGWINVCQWHEKEWSFNERKFIEVYKSNTSFNDGPTHLRGLSEEKFIDTEHLISEDRKFAFKESITPIEIKWHGYTKMIASKREPNNIASGNEIVNIIADKFSMNKPDNDN